MLNLATHESKVIVFPARVHAANANRILFLLSVNQVVDVLKTCAVCPVPLSPVFIDGITHWRDHVLPVISLEKRLGYRQLPTKSATRTIIAKAPKSHCSLDAPLVFSALRVATPMRLMAPPNLNETADRSLWPPNADGVRGVFSWKRGIIIVVDLHRILNQVHDIGGHSQSPALQGGVIRPVGRGLYPCQLP